MSRPDRLEPVEEMRQIGEAVEAVISARRGAAEAEAIATMPLLGVLFLALAGSPGERAEIDSPLVLALHAIRRGVEGWANQRSESTIFADVSYADLDLLVRRLDAVIEIARRSLPRVEDADTEGGAK